MYRETLWGPFDMVMTRGVVVPLPLVNTSMSGASQFGSVVSIAGAGMVAGCGEVYGALNKTKPSAKQTPQDALSVPVRA